MALLLALLVPAARAGAAGLPDDEDKALPCRPTIACTADTVPAGSVEIEVGYLARYAGGRTMQHSIPVLVKLSLTNWMQLQVLSNGVTIGQGDSNSRFLDDMMVGLKFKLNQQGRLLPMFGVQVNGSIPNAAQMPGYQQAYDLLFTGFITKDMGPIHADLNLGLNVWALDKDTTPQLWAALALSSELPKHVGAFVEGYYFSDGGQWAQHDAGVLFGVTWAPKPWFMFDVGADVALLRDTRSVSAFAGFTVIPLWLWDPGARRALGQNPLAVAPRAVN